MLVHKKILFQAVKIAWTQSFYGGNCTFWKLLTIDSYSASLDIHLILQRKPFAFVICYCWANAFDTSTIITSARFSMRN